MLIYSSTIIISVNIIIANDIPIPAGRQKALSLPADNAARKLASWRDRTASTCSHDLFSCDCVLFAQSRASCSFCAIIVLEPTVVISFSSI
jgi:hypothetical protein